MPNHRHVCIWKCQGRKGAIGGCEYELFVKIKIRTVDLAQNYIITPPNQWQETISRLKSILKKKEILRR